VIFLKKEEYGKTDAVLLPVVLVLLPAALLCLELGDSLGSDVMERSTLSAGR